MAFRFPLERRNFSHKSAASLFDIFNSISTFDSKSLSFFHGRLCRIPTFSPFENLVSAKFLKLLVNLS